MTDHPDIVFAPLSTEPENVCAALVGEELALAQSVRKLNTQSGGALLKAAEATGFKGKNKTNVELVAPNKLDLSRLLLIGCGDASANSDCDWVNLGGYLIAQVLGRKTDRASILVDVADPGDAAIEDIAADLAQGALLRQYAFTKYRTRHGEGSDTDSKRDGLEKLVIHCANPEKARAAYASRAAVANGVMIARDLVNEPANMLGPVEFADRVSELERLGLEIEILDVEALTALKMNALLGVGQGSARPSRVCIMQWHGAKSKRSKPLAFVGKGVVFDTGGISMKPAQGMGDMKGDMGGAACVTGLMAALAERKAAVNAVGIIGCVENMPSGNAIRPGDIITSMSGQTIEVLNTDAEGRLVLADILWYAQERFKPRIVIDFATLTGAIMIALGKEFAGLFSNDDKLSSDLLDAADDTGEKLWRMPLDKYFDKLIDTKNADMKNLGGRWGGASTAAQFLARFIKDTPWAHIDLAGTAMDATRSDINTSWGSGWGVRLIDRFVADNYEKN